jgi:hypothetical protein
VHEKILLLTQTHELCGDTGELNGIKYTKTLGFECLLELEYTETICNRGIDIECLECYTFTFGWIWMMIERLHIVQAISELDHDDSEITHHSEEHLAE